LKELEAVETELVLSDDELEFLTMNSIGAGLEVTAWVQRMRERLPGLLERILLAASKHEQAEIRRNCAAGLVLADFPATDQELVRLAMEDRDAQVREQAAVAIALADRRKLNEDVMAQLTGTNRQRALTTLARMRDESAMHQRARNLLQMCRRCA
jgi:hypothetical protein